MNNLVPVILVLLVAAIPLIWFIGTFNGLVRLRQHVVESWAGIDTELKRRYDLIPRLVETVKGYARHERETIEAVVQARERAAASTGTPDTQARDENALVGAVRQLFAVAEGYPELKASHNFLALQRELANTEDRIQAARRFYNANVRDLNTRIESFPSNLIASAFGFTQAQFFEIGDTGIREAPVVSIRE